MSKIYTLYCTLLADVLTDMNLYGIARKVTDYRLLSFNLGLGHFGVVEAQKKNEVYREVRDISFSLLEVTKQQYMWTLL